MARSNTTSTPSAFVCSLCGKTHMPAENEYVCKSCGPTGILEPLRLKKQSRPSDIFSHSPGIWRYERLLALSPDAPRPPLLVGGTPFIQSSRLGKKLGLQSLYIKNDSLNPTGSLKDRASAVSLARAAEIGAKVVAVASTGNAGSSLAGLAASMGIPAVIFVPQKAPKAKLLQALMYGARVFAVEGSYDDAFDLCLEACELFGWYNRNTAYNPYTLEGKKTVAYEIYEQLGQRAPDLVFVPTGDGAILSGVARGFRDLRSLGLIQHLPRLIAVQAKGSNSIAQAFKAGGSIQRIKASSVADSITVDLPRNGFLALRDLRESDGVAVVVSDEAILAAVGELASTTGIFAEPAAAATLAGLKAFLKVDKLSANLTVVLLVTGSGLKDPEAASGATSHPINIPPTLKAVEEAMEDK